MGPQLGAFEIKVADFTGYRYALGVHSGTAAIHLALLCHGVERDDVVISSTLTFCGAVNPILYLGACPVLVDSSWESWNIDPLLLEKAIDESEKKPKAILITHLFGTPADFDKIHAIGRKHDIPVIHDLAEALGCQWQHKKPGQLNSPAIVSFNGNKLITTSGGGAFLTNSEAQYKHALSLATQAKMQGKGYNHAELGYNYRLSNVLAGLGLGQFSAIASKIEKKRAIYTRYKKLLSDIKGISFQPEPTGAFSDRWLSAIYFSPNHFPKNPVPELIQKMEAANIEVRQVWKPMHLQPLYANSRHVGGDVATLLHQRGLCLPSGTGLSPSQQDRVIETLLNTLKAFL